MKAEPVEFSGRMAVEGYGPGFFRVGGALHQGALLLTPDAARPWDGGAEALTALDVDVILIGTGAERVETPLSAALAGAGFGVEVMATPAACRSFNVMMAEGRAAAAALTPV